MVYFLNCTTDLPSHVQVFIMCEYIPKECCIALDSNFANGGTDCLSATLPKHIKKVTFKKSIYLILYLLDIRFVVRLVKSRRGKNSSGMRLTTTT